MEVEPLPRALICATSDVSGFDFSQLAHAYSSLRVHGLEVQICSPSGGPLPVDVTSIRHPLQGMVEECLADQQFKEWTDKSLPVLNVHLTSVRLVLFIGGPGALQDFGLEHGVVSDLVTAAANARIPMGFVGEGITALCSARTAHGYLCAGARVAQVELHSASPNPSDGTVNPNLVLSERGATVISVAFNTSPTVDETKRLVTSHLSQSSIAVIQELLKMYNAPTAPIGDAFSHPSSPSHPSAAATPPRSGPLINKPSALVLGGSSHVGKRLVKGLIEKGYRVRVGTRTERMMQMESVKSVSPDVAVVDIDLSQPGTYDDALKGVDTVVFLTPPFSLIHFYEEQTKGFVELSRKRGVSHILKLSIPEVDGCLLSAFHQRDEALLRSLIPTLNQESQPNILNLSVVQSAPFMQDFLPESQYYGALLSAQGVLFGSSEDSPTPFVDAWDVADVIASMCLRKWNGVVGPKRLCICGPTNITVSSVASIISQLLSKEVPHIASSDITRRLMLSHIGDERPSFAQDVALSVDFMKHIGSGSFALPANSKDVEALLGRPLTDIAAFCRGWLSCWSTLPAPSIPPMSQPASSQGFMAESNGNSPTASLAPTIIVRRGTGPSAQQLHAPQQPSQPQPHLLSSNGANGVAQPTSASPPTPSTPGTPGSHSLQPLGEYDIINSLKICQSQDEVSPIVQEELSKALRYLSDPGVKRALSEVKKDSYRRVMKQRLSQIDQKEGSEVAEWLSEFVRSEKTAMVKFRKAVRGIMLANRFSIGLKRKAQIAIKKRKSPGEVALYQQYATSLVPAGPQQSNLLKLLEEAVTAPFEFDMFALDEASLRNPLSSLFLALDNRLNLSHQLNINDTTLLNLMKAVESSYRSENPYHNAIHAADVVLTVYGLLGEPRLKQDVPPLKKMAALLAAAFHDIDHPGVTNAYLITTSADLAIFYNDKSVLENHHAATAFKIMKEEENNIVNGLTRDEAKELRSTIITMIMATDMQNHVSVLSSFAQVSDEIGGQQSLAELDPDKMVTILDVTLHLADLGNPVKPIAVYRKWVDKVMEEFFAQGDAEKERGLPISPMMDRANSSVEKSQIGFIDFVVSPLYQQWGEFCGDYAKPVLDTLAYNKSWWEDALARQNANKS